MTLIGYHASHEQFAPSELLRFATRAAEAGFDCIKSSDHFHPWSERQGQSGFAWAWLGGAMQAIDRPFGIVSAPGYRYHPAVLAQAAATLAEMHPGRLWVALGSGEAVNESITGLPWPEKPERNARLRECVAIFRALLAGETVTHRGRITVTEARLYTRPGLPVPLFGAAVSQETARFCGSWADGLLTTGGDVSVLDAVIASFRAGGGDGKPVHVQHALSWAPSEDEAMAQALDQWAPASLGGEVAWDLRRPADFDRAARGMTAERLSESVFVSSDLGRHRAKLESIAAAGAEIIHLHHVGRNQEAFIDAFGASVLPVLQETAKS
jgi:coenzyme F420-dependent glucose-6-phosphate dehydrogenase